MQGLPPCEAAQPRRSRSLESHGLVPVTELGLVPAVGAVLSNHVTLEGGETKAFHFNVPGGASWVELRLTNTTGNPAFVERPGLGLPAPNVPIYAYGYGADGGFNRLLAGDLAPFVARDAVGDDHQRMGLVDAQRSAGVLVVLALRADQMLKTLKHARLDNSHELELRKLIAVDLLIVDDFCLDVMDAQESRDTYEILTERHRAGSMIVTSNRGPDEWLATFTDPMRAQSAIDRFTGNSYDLVIEGESYRRRLKPDARAGQRKTK